MDRQRVDRESTVRKLSEFVGQEATTSVLRAMVIKKEPARHIALLGNNPEAVAIVHSFIAALNCENPVKGDPCLECTSCLDPVPIYQNGSNFFASRYWAVVSDYVRPLTDKSIAVAFEAVPGYMKFSLNKTELTHISKDTLKLFIRALQGDRKLAIEEARALSTKTVQAKLFVSDYLEILKTVIYIKNNVEVGSVPFKQVLIDMAKTVPMSKLNSCFKILWDADLSNLSDNSMAIEGLAMLTTEILSPTEYYDVLTEYSEKPITTVENTSTVDNPLTLEKMFEIVSS